MIPVGRIHVKACRNETYFNISIYIFFLNLGLEGTTGGLLLTDSAAM